MKQSSSSILVTGADGFVGKNLVFRLKELNNFKVARFTRGDCISSLSQLVAECDVIVHLAGENRPKDPNDFNKNNVALTEALCTSILRTRKTGREVRLIFASSTQAVLENPYGKSKRRCELLIEELLETCAMPATIFRFPGIFGKWCKPNYNSVVATFCHNIARGKDILISIPEKELTLAYIDDVIDSIIAAFDNRAPGLKWEQTHQSQISIQELANLIYSFHNCRENLSIEQVGKGLTRALYSTYISYLPSNKFKYELARHEDDRGIFVEMLKTHSSGQISFFTAKPGVVRGGHYHHTKTEKFLVLKGEALFKFRNIITEEVLELKTSDRLSEVVDTIPGWAHDITNIGEGELIVMLWANENFDREKPDTIMLGL